MRTIKKKTLALITALCLLISTVTLLVANVGSTLAAASDPVREAFYAYLKDTIIEEKGIAALGEITYTDYEDMYSKLRTVETGVVSVMFSDLDGNGTEEMIVVLLAMDNMSDACTGVEVYRYNAGMVSLATQGSKSLWEIGLPMSVFIIEHEGKSYIGAMPGGSLCLLRYTDGALTDEVELWAQRVDDIGLYVYAPGMQNLYFWPGSDDYDFEYLFVKPALSETALEFASFNEAYKAALAVYGFTGDWLAAGDSIEEPAHTYSSIWTESRTMGLREAKATDIFSYTNDTNKITFTDHTNWQADYTNWLANRPEDPLDPPTPPAPDYRAVEGYKYLFEVLDGSGNSKEPKQYIWSYNIAPTNGSPPPMGARSAYVRGGDFYIEFIEGGGIFLAVNKDGTMNYSNAVWWGLDGEFNTSDDLATTVKEESGYYYWQQEPGVWQMIPGVSPYESYEPPLSTGVVVSGISDGGVQPYYPYDGTYNTYQNGETLTNTFGSRTSDFFQKKASLRVHKPLKSIEVKFTKPGVSVESLVFKKRMNTTIPALVPGALSNNLLAFDSPIAASEQEEYLLYLCFEADPFFEREDPSSWFGSYKKKAYLVGQLIFCAQDGTEQTLDIVAEVTGALPLQDGGNSTKCWDFLLGDSCEETLSTIGYHGSPQTWSLTSGTLPGGIMLGQTGLSGTFDTLGQFPFSLMSSTLALDWFDAVSEYGETWDETFYYNFEVLSDASLRTLTHEATGLQATGLFGADTSLWVMRGISESEEDQWYKSIFDRILSTFHPKPERLFAFFHISFDKVNVHQPWFQKLAAPVTLSFPIPDGADPVRCKLFDVEIHWTGEEYEATKTEVPAVLNNGRLEIVVNNVLDIANLYVVAGEDAAIVHPPQPQSGVYTILYDANGGTGAPASQSVSVDASPRTLKLSTVKPNREGYTFLGWALSKTSTSAQYQPGGTVTVNADITLYAVWQKNAAIVDPPKTGDGNTNGTDPSGNKVALTDTATGVVVSAEAGRLPEGTKLSVHKVQDDAYAELFGQGAHMHLYDIILTKDGKQIQPTGSVTVKIPLPADYTARNYGLYYVDISNNHYQKITPQIEGSNAVFPTDHFSVYGFASNGTDGGVETNGTASLSGQGNNSFLNTNSSNSGQAAMPKTGVGLDGKIVALIIVILLDVAFMAWLVLQGKKKQWPKLKFETPL